MEPAGPGVPRALARHVPRVTRWKDTFLPGEREEASRPQRAGFAAPEVAMATEPETPVAALAAEPAACGSLLHSLVQSG